MYIHRKNQKAFLANPKTASQATATALLGMGFRKFHKHSHHTTTPIGLGPDLREYSVAMTVRHPCDAAVSWLYHKNQNLDQPKVTKSFIERLLEDKHYFPHKDLFWGMHVDGANYVLRYEHLEEDLRGWLGEDIALPIIGITAAKANRDWRDMITAPARKVLRDRFSEEAAHYGYEI